MTSVIVYATAFGAAAALLFGAIWCFGRRSAGAEEARRDGEPDLRVLSRTRVGIGRTLVIVQVEGRRLLLGSTRAQWCAIADLGRAPEGNEEPVDEIDAALAHAANAKRFRGWNR
jgi:flagellar biogenesis protein FliO